MSEAIQGQVISVAVSSGGIPRLPVGALVLTDRGIAGDDHRYERHYAEDRGVSLFDLESIQRMSQADWPLEPGAAGENITLAGVHLDRLEIGQILAIDGVRLELTRLWIPCHAASHQTGEARVNSEKLPGYFARIVSPGTIEPGGLVTVEG